MEFTKGELEEVIECSNAINLLSKEDSSRVAQVMDEEVYDLTENQKANAKELVRRWNAFEKTEQQRDDLLVELADYKEGCEGLKLSIQDLRPVAECYRRVCESLGIEKDILGYVKKLTEQRAELLRACELTCVVCFRKKPDSCKTCKVGNAIAKCEA